MNGPGVAGDYTPLDTNMEFEDLTLPRDKFSRFRYFFVLRPYFTFLLLLDLALIGICPIWFNLREAGVIAILFFFWGILITTVLIAIICALSESPWKSVLVAVNADMYNLRGDTRNSVSFLEEVIMFRPSLDVNKWDLIAARLNRIFHRNNSNITPYFFYDGARCHSYFESYYVNRITSTFTNANRSEAENLIQPMIDEAVKVYKESLEEYWGQFTAQISDNSEQNNATKESNEDETVL